MVTIPESGVTFPVMMFISVDLPQPFGPMIPTRSFLKKKYVKSEITGMLSYDFEICSSSIVVFQSLDEAELISMVLSVAGAFMSRRFSYLCM